MSFAEIRSDGIEIHRAAAVGVDGRILSPGYDIGEGVQKVAMMVWNTSTLQWERSTGAGGGSGGSSPVNPTKRFDKVSSTLLYVGEATPGVSEASVGWSIKKISFDASGNATASLVGSGTWQDRYTNTYS